MTVTISCCNLCNWAGSGCRIAVSSGLSVISINPTSFMEDRSTLVSRPPGGALLLHLLHLCDRVQRRHVKSSVLLTRKIRIFPAVVNDSNAPVSVTTTEKIIPPMVADSNEAPVMVMVLVTLVRLGCHLQLHQ